MSNTPQTLVNIIKNISANQMQKTGYTTVVNAEVMTLVNPFTKEYKVKIDGIPVTAYGIYDIVYDIGSWVVVIESDVDNTKDRYIVAESNTIGNQSFDIAAQDKYDQIGAPIDLIKTETGWEKPIDLSAYLTGVAHPYFKITTDFKPNYTAKNFESKLHIRFNNGKTVTYTSSFMEGSLYNNSATEQTSMYFQIPWGATSIINIIEENIYCDPEWTNTKITIYNEVQDWEATALKILAPTGYMVISGENANVLEAKLRKDFVRINPDEVEYIWFRKNPLIVEGDEKYDARAGAGWEKIVP